MIKFFQFIKWCGRKIWSRCSSFVLATPIALYTFYKYVKEKIREETGITLCLWVLATMGVMAVILVSSMIYSATHNSYDVPLGHFIKISLVVSGILLFFVSISAIYDIFEEEQQEILRRLKE